MSGDGNSSALRPGGWAELVQLNVRVPRELRRRFHLLSRRDDLTADELLAAAIDLYEQRFGKAPERQRDTHQGGS